MISGLRADECDGERFERIFAGYVLDAVLVVIL